MLRAADGVPVEGALSVVFTLYADADGLTTVWSEQRMVDFDLGVFSLYLGDVTPTPAELFRGNQAVYLGVAVDGDLEMDLISIATAPYAAYAEYPGSATTLDGMSPSDFAAAGHTTPWSSLTDVPAVLADGDDDTVYTVASEGGSR